MVSTSVQKTVVGGQVSSVLLEVFLYGIYATVYAGTMYIYLSKKSSINYYVLASITSLFLLNGLKTMGQWATVIEIVAMNASQNVLATAYLFVVYGASTGANISLVSCYPITVIADGLMIWRCYKVWGDSLRIIAVLLLLVLAEAALYAASVIVIFGPNGPSSASRSMFDTLETAGLLVAVATTILSALLIFYRIHSISQKNVLHGGGGRYTRIVYLLTESSALYVIGLLLYAIPVAVPITDANMLWREGWASYSDPIFIFSSGMAPTIMVACISLTADDDVHEAPSHISTLKFHVQSTHVYLSRHESDI
ncbi:hypothetical protein HYPSUDRAFT_87502 [Hypholoma sublateritium FD-334 SS-4]|uniref:Uncharacterized protein n=1 Tax=Hypholoma sublateritium (strain FD-334 SS-4) TaxID=945553 RepID=A0A0D2P0M5_HYPSF|nr:hypothetical protein HYPSUDRAFT_87502 [Hypholoma sublateritium FD-334 SS-4]